MFLADNLRRLRRTAELTQIELADRIGVSHPRISEIESGRMTNPKLSTLTKISVALGVDVSDLLAEPAKKKTKKRR